MGYRNRALVHSLLGSAMTSGLFLAVGPASAQDAPGEDAPREVAVGPAQDIVVIGVRASLKEAIETKRASTTVVDSIVATDIADFPQSNLAEALQRVSGIQLRRDFAGGVGNEISVRGLGPDYTQVLINGQSAPSSSDGRTFNFNALPAELFRRVDVFKSVTADIDEGGIGGTVSLETIRPFDFRRGQRGVITGELVYNENTGKTSPRGTLVASQTWGDRAGIVLGAAYSEFSAASDSYDAVRWTRRNLTAAGTSYSQVFLMDLPRLIHEEQKVKRLSVTGSGQYRFGDGVELFADGLYIDNRQRQDRLTPIWDFAGAVSGINSIAVRDGVVEAIDVNNLRYRSENNTDRNNTETYKVGAKLRVDLGGWRITPFVTTNRSLRDNESYRFFGDRRGRTTYDTRQDDDYYTITTTYDIADPTGLAMSEIRHNSGYVEDKETATGYDVRYLFNKALRLDLGSKLRWRSKERRRFGRTVTTGLTTNGVADSFADIATIYTDFLPRQERAKSFASFAVADFDKAIAKYGGQLDISAAEEVNNFFDVDERLISGYGMLTYEAGKWLANVGLRGVDTRLTSIGSERTRSGSAPFRPFVDRSVKTNYFDLLPSANLRFEAIPNLFLRAAAAKVVTRPNLADLAAYREINDVAFTISAKNPDLKPVRADQVDLAAEYYYAPNSLVSIGLFYKAVSGFIASRATTEDIGGQTYTVTKPVNLNDATIKGVEFNFQQAFTFLPGPLKGLGVAFNYTYTDTSFEETLVSGTTLTYGLPENSRDSYNLVGYYEDDRFSLRGAYNFRGRFLREVPNVQDGLKYRDDYGQLDMSARLKIGERFALTLDVLNMLDAMQEEFVYEERLTDGTFTTGRTVQFGLRGKF
jgi:iron complex outermembrane recepter protein